MKEYSPSQIRNVCLASHSGSGKTSLAEACLMNAGAVERAGSVESGQTVSDYLPDEIKRKSSPPPAWSGFPSYSSSPSPTTSRAAGFLSPELGRCPAAGRVLV